MKILTVIGARPQFIKAAAFSRAISEWKAGARPSTAVVDLIIHTGQHYDDNMSKIFFDELQIPPPDVNLAVGSGSQGRQTGQMMVRLEEVIKRHAPDWVLVYGDTNSTLAGALTAMSLRIPVAHVEAGLRSYNREMPEEHNRILTDHCSDLLLCPSQTAVDNLAREGIREGVYLVGDVMYDAVLYYKETSARHSTLLRDLGLKKKEYLLVTVHRPANADDISNLSSILRALVRSEWPVIFPVHPRTRKLLKKRALAAYTRHTSIRFMDPVGYLDMIALEQSARTILTDSGGIQKEAYWLGVPCVTLREETEWVETVQSGWSRLVGADERRIIEALRQTQWPSKRPRYYGNGRAARKILDVLLTNTGRIRGKKR